MADLARVEQWYRAMEKLGQENSPFVFGGITLTPNQLLKHARANDDVWKKVQNYI